MCGRYSLTENIDQLEEIFNFEFSEEISPRYNIAPGQQILTIVSHGAKRVGKNMKWGLVPGWSKEPKVGYKMINARAERIDSKPSFKGPFKKRRTLIPSSGFYEWKKSDNGKQPYRFILKDNKPFAFAGLWETWDKGDNPLITCTIITTRPNAITEEVHDRMPVILHEDSYDTWLNPNFDDTEYLKSLLLPYPAQEMESFPVSTLVNSVKNNQSEIVLPINSF